MQAFPEFRQMDASFWALVKYISETLGYTDRKTKTIRSYTDKDISDLLIERNINASESTVSRLKAYFDKRADLLNNTVRYQLMDAESARIEFERLLQIHTENGYICKLPVNKQKGQMARINYYTAMINILAERVIRNSSKYDGSLGFNDDPRGLAFVLNENHELIGASSRRFDGAYPDIVNPKAVWEIKEYYYTTTFGSRVADGVYETQLDGYEFRDIKQNFGKKVIHIFFTDAYKTWWDDGKSYLCRIIDFLNAGLVDEVIIGREVLTRWPELLKQIIE
jgi:hypothetical protein